MKIIYKKDYTLSDFAVDCNGNLKLSTLLYFAQETAGRHCQQLGVDHDTLAQKNLFWAVTRHKVLIHRLPRRDETITVETWPMPTTRVAYPRSCAGYDRDGKLLFHVISIWVLIDIHTRKMVLPGKSNIPVDGILRGFEPKMPHSLMPAARKNQLVRTVTYSCLDRNGHMNNTRYLDWVDDLLPSSFHSQNSLRCLTICYLSEAREGQQIHLNWTLDEDKCLHVDAHRFPAGEDENPISVFSAQVQF